MDRRQFLVRAATSVGALITPPFIKQVLAWTDVQKSPLLVLPVEPLLRTIFAVPGPSGYYMHFGDPTEEPPEYTWSEFAEEQGCYGQREILEYLRNWNDGISVFELRSLLNAPADSWLVSEWWEANYASSTLAFNYLDELDLGPEFGRSKKARGDVRFIEGYCPGNDTRMVEVGDDLSLSLLQARLNELGERTEIVVESF